MISDHQLSGEHGDQLAFDGMLPRAGERYRNMHSGWIATVIGVQQHRKTWVQIRFHERDQELELAAFRAAFTIL